MELVEVVSTRTWVEHPRYFLEQNMFLVDQVTLYLHHYLLRFRLHFLPPLPLPFLLHLHLLGTKEVDNIFIQIQVMVGT